MVTCYKYLISCQSCEIQIIHPTARARHGPYCTHCVWVYWIRVFKPSESLSTVDFNLSFCRVWHIHDVDAISSILARSTSFCFTGSWEHYAPAAAINLNVRLFRQRSYLQLRSGGFVSARVFQSRWIIVGVAAAAAGQSGATVYSV